MRPSENVGNERGWMVFISTVLEWKLEERGWDGMGWDERGGGGGMAFGLTTQLSLQVQVQRQSCSLYLPQKPPD